MKVPEPALMELDAAIGRAEPDEEIRDLLKASVGITLLRQIDWLSQATKREVTADEAGDERALGLS